ncbi:PIN domain-containing protein [Nitrospira sp. Kam-Ns4a]
MTKGFNHGFEQQALISPFILSELDRVLRQKFHFSKKEADARVRAIRTMAHLVEPAERITVIAAKDDDNRILECALAAHAEFLVTGDKAHLVPLGSHGTTRIVTPAQLLDLLEAPSS